MQFSVIVPTYNRPGPLRQCLRALSELDFPKDRYEVIVVDDGSEPPVSEADLQGAGVPAILVRQVHSGPAAARNTGAGRARGEFLAFTDDDCLPQADWLRRLDGHFARDPRGVLNGRKMNMVPENPYDTASQVIIDAMYDHFNKDPNDARACSTSSLALAAGSFRTLGGFDETFMTWEDQEFGHRLRHRNLRLTFAPDVIVWHACGMTHRYFIARHFAVGRGAVHFHRYCAACCGEKLRLAPGYYRHLLRQAGRHGRGARRLPLMLYVLLAQASYAIGFLVGRFARSPDAPSVRRGLIQTQPGS